MKFGSAKQRFDISTYRYMADTLKHLVSMQNTVEAFEEKPGEEFKESKTYTHSVSRISDHDVPICEHQIRQG
jgi:hypothetical protein